MTKFAFVIWHIIRLIRQSAIFACSVLRQVEERDPIPKISHEEHSRVGLAAFVLHLECGNCASLWWWRSLFVCALCSLTAFAFIIWWMCRKTYCQPFILKLDWGKRLKDVFTLMTRWQRTFRNHFYDLALAGCISIFLRFPQFCWLTHDTWSEYIITVGK